MPRPPMSTLSWEVSRAYFGMDLCPMREARTKGIDGNIYDNRVMPVLVAMSKTMSFCCDVVTPFQNTLFPLCRFCCIKGLKTIIL